MTPQEQQMIDGLIDRIRNTQITDRDPIAAAHLQQGLGGNPDAIYILAQTVLVQQQALLQAQSQIQSTNAELAQLREAAGHAPQPSSGSWLDRFFGPGTASQNQNYPHPGYGAPPPSSNPPQPGYQNVNTGQQQAYPPQTYPQQAYPIQGYPPQGYPQQSYGAPGVFGQPSGGGSFLRTAATTAAGVAAGAFLYEGVESMFGGHNSGSNFGGGGFGGGGFGGGHEGGTTVNNYYEDHPTGEHREASTSGDKSFYNPSDDASRDDTDASEHDAQHGFANTDNMESDEFAPNDAASGDDDSNSSDDSFDDSGSSNDDV